MASLRAPVPPPGLFSASTETLVGSLSRKSSKESLDVKDVKDVKRFHPSVSDLDLEKRLPELPIDFDLPTIPKPSVEIQGYRFYVIMLCLCMGNFLAYFTETAVMTSLRVIGNQFHESSNQSWIATTFTLGFILPQLVIGRLCDIFGRSAVYNGTILLFAIGTLWCGLSESFPSLLAARVIQGIGAAGRQTVGSVIIVDLTTKHNRGTWLGFFNFALSLGLTAGLLIGGVITTHTTWRWSFWSCLICMAVVFILGVRYMSYPVPNRKPIVGIKAQLRELNWIGTVGAILIAALICIPLELGVNNCPWSVSRLQLFGLRF
jgi:MFS family permease